MITHPPVQMFQRQFTGMAWSAKDSRRFVTASAMAAGVPGLMVDDVVLVGDELVSNALGHSASGSLAGTYSVRVDVAEGGRRVTLHVRDLGGEPSPQWARPKEEGGLGLVVVRQLAAEYGTGPAGKCTCEGSPYARCCWAIVALPSTGGEG